MVTSKLEDIYVNTYNEQTKSYIDSWFDKKEPCKVIDGIRKQNEGKPWWLRSNSIMISCNYPKCRVIC